MKTKSKISGHITRSGAAAVFFLFALVALSSAFNSNRAPKPAAATGSAASAVKAPNQAGALSFAERVAYQRAIEEVNWRHRIWPKANTAPKPSLDKVMTQAQIAQKVEDYLRNSQALEDYWQKPITPDQLQAEMERIASHTKQPGMLRELFAALGDDPFVIAECLVRPVLAERLLIELYAHDQRFHGELKQRAEAELRTYPSVKQMKQTSGKYTEVEWIKSDSGKTGSTPVDTKETEALNMSSRGFGPTRHAAALESADMSAHFKNSAVDKYETLPIGKLSPLQEEDGHYYAVAVMKAQVPMTMAAVSADYTLPVITDRSDNWNPSVPCTDDTWTATSLTNAPAGRREHTAVWTGSEMIVWGGLGSGGLLNTGGRYNPSTDSWTATSTTNAPSGRATHTAVWTGSEVIVWGGSISGGYLNTGGRYSPSTDSWTATSTANAPSARDGHTAVWTGSQMIVWGGYGQVHDFNTGGRYNPGTDSWAATSTTNAPSARDGHTAVWTGSEMIIWGGGINDFSNPYNTGGRYNPGTDSWTATSTTNAPAASSHTAVWTGSQMIVWGGCQAPDVFCGRGNAGGRYNPGTDSWAATSTTNAPSARNLHTAVWTGSEMIIWGGFSPYINSGGRYNPITDSWTATSTANAPSARGTHTAVWTGSQIIVWGGYDGSNYLNTGGRYCAQSGPPTIVSRYDFNGDGKPDYLLYNAATGQSAIWYMNNNAFISGAYGPTLPSGWQLIGAADFNLDGRPDYVLYNPATRRTAIWYMNNNIYVSGAYGPTLPSGWQLVTTGDFNLDGRPDYILYNFATRQTAIWYMNNNAYVTGAYGPTLPANWVLAGTADFNGDGKPDYLLYNAATGQSAIWYMNNNAFISGAYGPTLPSGWQLIGAADFNLDGRPDYVLYNPATRRTAIWYMNNNIYVSGAYGPTLPSGWSL